MQDRELFDAEVREYWTQCWSCHQCGSPIYVDKGAVMVSPGKFDAIVAARWAEMSQKERGAAIGEAHKNRGQYKGFHFKKETLCELNILNYPSA